MRPRPDENGAIWLDSVAIGLANEVCTSLGPEAKNPAARRAVLHHLIRARLSITKQKGRSTPEELEAIVHRLNRVFDRKEIVAQRRRRRDFTYHPAVEPVVPEEQDLPGGELPAVTAYDPVAIEIRRAAAPAGGDIETERSRFRRRKQAAAQEQVAA